MYIDIIYSIQLLLSGGSTVPNLCHFSVPREAGARTVEGEDIRWRLRGLGFAKLSHRVEGFGLRFRVSGLRFRVPGLRVSGLGLRVSGLGLRVLGLGFQVWWF